MATTTVLHQRQPSVQESLLPQQLREWAVWWGSLGGRASHARAGGAGAGGPCSGGGQQRQKRSPETLSPHQLREWAVRWGSFGGGAWGTSAGGGEAPGGVEAVSLGGVDSASTVVARGATILPCPTAPSGLLTGLHLPSFAKNLVATSVLQDQWVTVTQPGGELVAIFTDPCTGEHLATFTWRPGYGLYTLTTESALVAESGHVAALVEVASSCSCRLLTHQTLLWHHRLGHPSLPCLCGMHSCLLVSGLPRSLPLLPRPAVGFFAYSLTTLFDLGQEVRARGTGYTTCSLRYGRNVVGSRRTTGHSLSAPPSDESVEPSGPYPKLVGCLITSGMGLVLGGRGSVFLTSHSYASWADDQTTHRSKQGYNFSLSTGSVSWRSTCISSVLSSTYEAEIYAGAMAAQELL
ncbi:unnamed protein product [Closterium sp. NIES-53]